VSRLRPLPVIAVALVVGLGVDLLTGYSPFPGYPAALGLLGGALLTFGAKSGLARLVQRPNDYYPEDETPAVQEDLRG
jgi:hypothetical protein